MEDICCMDAVDLETMECRFSSVITGSLEPIDDSCSHVMVALNTDYTWCE